MSGAARWWWAVAISASTVLVALLVTAPDTVTDWDTLVKYQVARNIAQGNGAVLLEPTPDDRQFVREGRGGRRVSYFPVLAVLAWIPVWCIVAAGGPLFAALPTIVAVAALAGILVLWARRAGVTPVAAVAGALATCLGTLLRPCASLEYDTVVEAVALATLCWAAGGDDRRRDWIIAGLALAVAVCTRITAVLLAVPALLLVARREPRGAAQIWRRLLWLAVGFLPAAPLWAAYDLYRFGVLFRLSPPPQSSSVVFLSDYCLAIAGFLVSPGKGFLWYSPLLIVLLPLLPAAARRWGAALAAAGVWGIAAMLFYARYIFWHGDWCWGPRYLVPLCVAAAPLTWTAAQRLPAGRAARARAALAGVAALAIVMQCVATLPPPVGHYMSRVTARLAGEGRLATSPSTDPPLPADWGTLYWTPAHSPLLVQARAVVDRFFGRWELGTLADALRVLLGLIVPALALGAVVRLRPPEPVTEAGPPPPAAAH